MLLPLNRKEMLERGWRQPDFIIVTGDAYVDHHSYGTAIISRLLEAHGFKVCIMAQPNWKNTDDFTEFGRPRLAFLVNSGVVDSMVNNYSVFKRRRKKDEYSPGGVAGKRPDRAVQVYCNRIREVYKDVPVVIGGIEASLRRFGHYDYWSDKVRRSILLDSGADLLIYGMGERAVVELAEALNSGISIGDITWIKGTVYKAKDFIQDKYGIRLPDFDEIERSKEQYCKSFRIKYENTDYLNALILAEKYPNGIFVVQNTPQPVLEREELDRIYELPFENKAHSSYVSLGGIPAFNEVKYSIVSNRGCFGGCAFCAITYHQGRQVRSRSKASLIDEAESLTKLEGFKGYIHDLGGPTANFHGPACKKQIKHGVCPKKDCLHPHICDQMEINHDEYFDTLREMRKLNGIKKVFIRSGIRYDYLLKDPKSDKLIEELCENHVSGILKIAPEHVSKNVLQYMKKPEISVFKEFAGKYKDINKKLGKKQYLIPYFISSHPGSTLEDAIELALFLKEYGFIPDQVQDFYPTPGTLATCMYHTEKDPWTGEDVYVAKTIEEKKLQRALIHFHKKENGALVVKALKKANREDLIPLLLGVKGRVDNEYNRKDKNGTGERPKARRKNSLKHRGRTGRQ